MDFEIGFSEELGVTDDELTELLDSVYVNEGYTPRKLAKTIFAPSSVRARGTMLIARKSLANDFAGMIIVVPASSSARVLASKNECEMHLLGVKAEYRRFKLGRKLVEAALAYSKQNDWTRMLLWTQKSMTKAQCLYISCGFKETGKMKKNEIEFLIYEKHFT